MTHVTEANPIYILKPPTWTVYDLAIRALIFAAVEGVLISLMLSRNMKWLPTLPIAFLANLGSIPTTWYIFSVLSGSIGLYAIWVAELVPVFGEFLIISASVLLIGRMRISGVTPNFLTVLGLICVANLITFMLGSFMYGAVSPF